MTGFEHTALAIAVIGVSFVVGKMMGSSQGYAVGFSDGVGNGVDATFQSISKHYNINFDYDVEIKEESND